MRFGDDILDLADWERRHRAFSALRDHDDGGARTIPTMLFAPPERARTNEWRVTRDLWLDLDPHPNVLDGLVQRGRSLQLRYAALYWGHKRILGAHASGLRQIATWGVQLADAVRTAIADVRHGELGWLTNPFVNVDVGRQVRIGFLPPTPGVETTTVCIAPEVRAQWPHGDERSLVYMVGAMLHQLWVGIPPEDECAVARVMRRATDDDPAERHPSLLDLRDAFVFAGGSATSIRRGAQLEAWNAAEAGMGMLAMNRLDSALEWFEEASRLDAECFLAQWGTSYTRRSVSVNVLRSAAIVLAPTRAWTEAAPEAEALERRGSHKAALATYATIVPRSAPGGALYVALARCHLALGDTGHAIDYARRALSLDARNTDAMLIEVRAFLARRQFADALDRIDVLRARLPDDADLLYLGARALLGARRLAEARDAFDAVLAARPTMIAAMLLRREADRMLLGVRAETGVQAAASADEHLDRVRSMVIEGRAEEAIDELAKPEHADDPLARLLLADSLLAAQRADEALAVFVRVAQLGDPHREAAVVGTAYALLGLGRSEEALAMFEQACDLWPANLDALEGHAQALEAQGRADEAEALHRRAVAARAARSDLRLHTRSM